MVDDRFKVKRILRITVMQRPTDYFVFYDHDPRLWANGISEAEAIGNLILNRQDQLRRRVEVTRLQAQHINKWKIT